MIVQVSYASRATFEPVASSAGVEPTVARILQVSKRNNAKQGIGGALYYRDGAFFQVLEGSQDAVEALLKKLKLDARHSDFKILHTRQVSDRTFGRWSMKYTQLDERVNQWLQERGRGAFQPDRFSAEQAEEFAQVLQRAEETALNEASQPDPVEERGPVLAIASALGITSLVLLGALYYAFF